MGITRDKIRETTEGVGENHEVQNEVTVELVWMLQRNTILNNTKRHK